MQPLTVTITKTHNQQVAATNKQSVARNACEMLTESAMPCITYVHDSINHVTLRIAHAHDNTTTSVTSAYRLSDFNKRLLPHGG